MSDTDWLNKLEGKLDVLSDKIIEASTKLDIYLSRQDDHEQRLRDLEIRQNNQNGVNAENKKRWAKWATVLIGVQALTACIGVLIVLWIRK